MHDGLTAIQKFRDSSIFDLFACLSYINYSYIIDIVSVLCERGRHNRLFINCIELPWASILHLHTFYPIIEPNKSTLFPQSAHRPNSRTLGANHRAWQISDWAMNGKLFESLPNKWYWQHCLYYLYFLFYWWLIMTYYLSQFQWGTLYLQYSVNAENRNILSLPNLLDYNCSL